MSNDTKLKKIIGSNIRKRRLEIEMTLLDLADLVGITTGYLGLIERGERLGGIGTIAKISSILCVSIDDLITDAAAVTTKTDPAILRINSYLKFLHKDDLKLLAYTCNALRAKNDN